MSGFLSKQLWYLTSICNWRFNKAICSLIRDDSRDRDVQDLKWDLQKSSQKQRLPSWHKCLKKGANEAQLTIWWAFTRATQVQFTKFGLVWVYCCLTAFSAQTGNILCHRIWNISCSTGGQDKYTIQLNNETIHSLSLSVLMAIFQMNSG